MSSDHQDFHPHSVAADHHRQPFSSTAGNNIHGATTSLLPQTPSAMSPDNNTTAVEANSTPESRLATALGHVIMSIPSTSFEGAAAVANATNQLLRQLSDATSSANQVLPPTTTTTTPPIVPRNNQLNQTHSDTITTDHEKNQKTRKNPLRRTLSDPVDRQQHQKTRTPPPRVSSSPTEKQSPQSERLRKMEEMLREIERKCWEIIHEQQVEDGVNPNATPPRPQPQDEQEECVGVERLKNGDLRFELSCSCGKRFEMLLKHNGYCFYRLT